MQYELETFGDPFQGLSKPRARTSLKNESINTICIHTCKTSSALHATLLNKTVHSRKPNLSHMNTMDGLAATLDVRYFKSFSVIDKSIIGFKKTASFFKYSFLVKNIFFC